MNRLSFVLFIFSVSSVLGAGKRGLCIGDPFNYATDFQPFTTTPAVSWYYNWSPNPKTTSGPSQIQFVPMQWNGNNIANFEKTVVGQCASHVLAFNEPDLGGQANMDPQTACNLWTQYIVPLKTKYGIKIGLPVISAGGGNWLKSFMQYCPPATNQGDFLPLHWYGSPDGSVGGFYDYIWSMHGQYPTYPIWITEFASETNDMSKMVSFGQSAFPYLDTLNWVERYAFFGTFRNNSAWPVATLSATGQLSPVGQAYVNAASNNTAVTLSTCSYATVTRSAAPATGNKGAVSTTGASVVANNATSIVINADGNLIGHGAGMYNSPSFFVVFIAAVYLILA